MGAAIVMEGLTKDYGRTLALSDLSLEVQRGEILGFLGPNGAGKTTAIRIVLDLIRATAGRASVMGHDCHRDSVAARAQVGYLPGDVHLPPNLRGDEFIRRLGALRPREIDPKRLEVLGRRLGADLTRRTGELSKGNKQAVALLAALADRPPVLILDEPTGGLDPIRQHEVLAILAEEASAGTAVFFSSHVLSEVEHACERVAVLRAGRLMAIDSVARITGSARQRFEVVFAGDGPPARLDAPGVTELSRTGRTLVVEVTGEADAFIKALAAHRVASLHAVQTGLEEAVLHLYRDGGS
ncbi:MAG: ABC transporter ATP-binding protein [Thermoleophilia bacterium]|jgi:ABC-2 type transport system ATP-binding protein